ncbi:MAG: glucosamine-6-phosphate deaminase [Oscillospiraceae bacterium]|nr:glucosamine-6-phosphate deaminase [Oscillospiraceae bacterium]
MEYKIFKTKEEIAICAADFFCDALAKNPKTVLGLATGSSPIHTYKELARRVTDDGLDFSGVSTFNLDEYCGLDGSHHQSYRYFMEENLFKKVGILPENVHFLDGKAKNFDVECTRFENELRSIGPVDLQLLGIGRNGHIGFNEPAEKLHSACFRVELAPETIKANQRFFAPGEEVPRSALTMGMGTILSAKKIVLIATGESKAQAIAHMLKGEISGQCPASFLRTHRDAIALLDEAAARNLMQ